MFDEVKEGSAAWVQFIPAHIGKLMETTLLKGENIVGDWDVAAASEVHGKSDFKTLKDGWQAYKAELKECKRKLDAQVQEAKLLVEETV